MTKSLSIFSTFVLGFVFAVSALASTEIAHWQTSNGVDVYFVAAPEIPMLDVRLVYKAGSARDGDKHGIASLTADLMDQGAGNLDANTFNDKLADTGASFGAGALRDMAWLSMRTLSEDKYAKPALELFRQVAIAPSFEAEAVSRAIAAKISSIRRQASSPGSVANNAIRRAVFGNHPYAHPTRGEEDTVSAITQAEIKSFHRKYYVAENAILAIVGALTKDKAVALAEKLTAELPTGQAAGPIPPVNSLDAKSKDQIEFDSIQSHVRVGLPGMKRGDDDYVPLFVGNHVLGGGGLVSLLFDEVREKRGLSYGVNSYFAPSEQLGIFVASLQTDGSQVDEALNVLVDTMDTFIKEGPPADRLEAAKQNLIGGFPLRIDSNSETIEYISMIGFYGLPLDYLETFPKKVAEVNAEQIKDAFTRRVNLERAAIVVVGKENNP